jgi:molecular chaperone HtpG
LVQSLPEFDGKPLRSPLKGTLALGDEQERQARARELEEAKPQFLPLLEAFQRALDADVRAVRLSPRLVESPACLTCEPADESPRLEQLLLRGKGGGPRQRRVLELNPNHAMILRLLAEAHGGLPSARLDRYARLLYAQALLAEGSDLADTAAFALDLTALMTDTLTGEPQ